MENSTEIKLAKHIRGLVRLIQSEANNGLTTENPKSKSRKKNDSVQWQSAYLDSRWFADADGFSGKYRIILPNGEVYGLISVTREMKDILYKISKLRKDDPAIEWYGLKITVTPDGEFTHELNRDPNCVVDPQWFKS